MLTSHILTLALTLTLTLLLTLNSNHNTQKLAKQAKHLHLTLPYHMGKTFYRLALRPLMCLMRIPE